MADSKKSAAAVVTDFGNTDNIRQIHADEKTVTADVSEPRNGLSATHIDQETDFVTHDENRDLKRGLSQRHISLVAIAGAIGTGLFLGVGEDIQAAGPLGALLGYATVGLIVCAMQFALGEVSALLPVTGSYVRHAEFFVDPALGFAVGWNVVYNNWLSIPAETTAICVLFQFWTPVNSSVWIILTIVLTFTVGMTIVRLYGEIEFWFGLLKIALIIFLIVFGLVTALGGIPGVPRLGFHYWKDPGPFVPFIASGASGNFLGYWSVMTSAVFAFSGTESLSAAAAETRNPRQAIPKACKRVFWRVTIFYLLAVLVVGMLVASNDPRLNNDSGTAAQSPFVIAASAAGVAAIPSVINAVVITSAWSSSNQALLVGTRVLYALALKKQAPKIFLRTTKWGIPYMCVLIQTAFMFLAFMTLNAGALNVFYWLIDLVGCAVLVSWSAVLFNHQRLIMAMKKQKIPFSRLPWHNSWTRFSTPAALALCLLILLTSGFKNFTRGGFTAAGFISAYLDVPLTAAVYTGWKIYKKTKIVRLEDIPLEEAFRKMEDEPEQPEEKAKGWIRFISWIWD